MSLHTSFESHLQKLERPEAQRKSTLIDNFIFFTPSSVEDETLIL